MDAAPRSGQRAGTESGAAEQRFDAAELIRFAARLLEKAGVDGAIARDVAEVLVEGDLLGHDTHGLQLLAPYLGEIENESMTRSGEPLVVTERGAVATWDGRRLPGPWLVRRAIAWAAARARIHGAATVVIRRSHHIACLAAYLESVAREGLVVLLSCSDPEVASVAPYGGTEAVFTPDPIAIGFPTSGDPVMVDVSASITTNGMSARLHKAGERGAHRWWLDARGRPTDDPGVIFDGARGTILPLGGLDAGHKGYGLALTIEALTGALAGHGRADPHEGWGATVYLQLYDPAAFAGADAFVAQTDWIAQACRTSTAIDPARPVRLPGERGLARKREQLARGVQLQRAIMPALRTWTERLGVAAPAPRAGEGD